MHRFMVLALQDPPLCSSTVLTSVNITDETKCLYSRSHHIVREELLFSKKVEAHQAGSDAFINDNTVVIIANKITFIIMIETFVFIK
jgi:hypothetical protein